MLGISVRLQRGLPRIRLSAPKPLTGSFMSAPTLSVPEPLADDGEDITTALETAAIFNAQGDLREAVRWVRKAAEAAGDAGNGLRALALARAVADLNIGASVVPSQVASAQPAAAPASAAAPVPPPLPSAPAPASAAAVSERGSVRPSPVVRIEAAADAPPPPPLPAAARDDAPPPPPPLPSAAPAPQPGVAAIVQPTIVAPPPFPEETDEPTPIARPSWPELSPPVAAAHPGGNGAASAVPAAAP